MGYISTSGPLNYFYSDYLENVDTQFNGVGFT